MKLDIISTIVATAAVLGAPAFAADLIGLPPFAGYAFGQQSDANTGPAYEQTFTAEPDMVLEAIRWWGFHGQDSLGSSYDHFVVRIGGQTQSGAITIESASPYFDQYTLDVVDMPLTSSTLSIINDNPDVAWFWQSAEAVGNPSSPDANAVAFTLLGSQVASPVPEPSAPVLGSLGLVMLAASLWARRQRPM